MKIITNKKYIAITVLASLALAGCQEQNRTPVEPVTETQEPVVQHLTELQSKTFRDAVSGCYTSFVDMQKNSSMFSAEQEFNANMAVMYCSDANRKFYANGDLFPYCTNTTYASITLGTAIKDELTGNKMGKTVEQTGLDPAEIEKGFDLCREELDNIEKNGFTTGDGAK